MFYVIHLGDQPSPLFRLPLKALTGRRFIPVLDCVLNLDKHVTVAFSGIVSVVSTFCCAIKLLFLTFSPSTICLANLPAPLAAASWELLTVSLNSAVCVFIFLTLSP